jgi:hypothetical protein
MPPPPGLERVVLDSSVRLGAARREIVAAAALHYYTAFWSPWLVGEFVRQRTEWIAERAAREGCDRAETRKRLRASRQRVNALLHELSHVLPRPTCRGCAILTTGQSSRRRSQRRPTYL